MPRQIESVVILGGGTAGWITAAYLQKIFGNTLTVTLLEAPTIPRIGVGEATVPNLQRVLFDRLEIAEADWMRECNGAFKIAVKFVNWRKRAPGEGSNHFYHPFGLLPNVDNIPLSHYWVHRYERGDPEAVDYACFVEPPLMDAKLAPRFADGTRAMWYAWHFDAARVAGFLQRVATGWGVHHIIDEFQHAERDEGGYLTALVTTSGRRIPGDLFVDCSGFRGLLINQAMSEPFVDMSQHLLCDSAVATQLPNDDERDGIEPYTSAIAMRSGWTWKIPMLGRFGTGYVYASRFCSEDDAVREFADLWKIDPAKVPLNRIRFRVGRNRRAWVKNCVSIGLSSCFVEPLESSGIYFIYAAVYQLAKHFPDASFSPTLIDHFNREIEQMFDDTRDFLQAHYLTSTRDDTPFWRANKHDLVLTDSIRAKIATYESGLTVNMPVADEGNYYGNFETEFHNFWTNGSYYCIFSGMGLVPQRALPTLSCRPHALRAAEGAFAAVKNKQRDLAARLPSNYQYLANLHRVSEDMAWKH